MLCDQRIPGPQPRVIDHKTQDCLYSSDSQCNLYSRTCSIILPLLFIYVPSSYLAQRLLVRSFLSQLFLTPSKLYVLVHLVSRKSACERLSSLPESGPYRRGLLLAKTVVILAIAETCKYLQVLLLYARVPVIAALLQTRKYQGTQLKDPSRRSCVMSSKGKGRESSPPLELFPDLESEHEALKIPPRFLSQLEDLAQGIRWDESLSDSDLMDASAIRFPMRGRQNRQRPCVPLTWRVIAERKRHTEWPVEEPAEPLTGPLENNGLASEASTMAVMPLKVYSLQTVYSNPEVDEAMNDAEWTPETRVSRELAEDEHCTGSCDHSPDEEEADTRPLRRIESAPGRLGGATFESWEQRAALTIREERRQSATEEDELVDGDLQPVANVQQVDVLQLVKRLEMVERLVGAPRPAQNVAAASDVAQPPPAAGPPAHSAERACPAGRLPAGPSFTSTHQIGLAAFFLPFLVYSVASLSHFRSIPPCSAQDLISRLSVSSLDPTSSVSQYRSSDDPGYMITAYDFASSIKATPKDDICVRNESPRWTLRLKLEVHGVETMAAKVAEREAQRRPTFRQVWVLMVAVIGVCWLLAILAQRPMERIEAWIGTVGQDAGEVKSNERKCISRTCETFEGWGRVLKVVVGSAAAAAIIAAVVVTIV
ncbi:hypothetical protein T440DRAFT_234394 [Plenodomus tracheiphilus IPT5]|uniref:Uncharacterized protein n=1 Tax=Plenodomus tracheiphilus IPT5 TaxID=1408161 RepID=A0A6A7BG28_9PLEO|nr:hypothetical protein T440DRAFT_234394 [Plenodomus tracheiphilus IPT5]